MLSTFVALGALGCRTRPQTAEANTARSANPEAADVVRPDPELVQFVTRDGWTLAGDLRLRRAGGTAVVFVHQLSSNRGEWAEFAQRVAGTPPGLSGASGTITTLSIDLRGHGESTQSPSGRRTWNSFGNDRAEWVNCERDVEAAVDYVRQRARTTKIILVGSSIGGTVATLYSARVGAPIRGLALLSPGLSYRGIDLLPPLIAASDHGVSVYAVSAAGDRYSADTLRELEARMTAPRDAGTAGASVVRRIENSSAHGVSMGQAPNESMWVQLKAWIDSIEGPTE